MKITTSVNIWRRLDRCFQRTIDGWDSELPDVPKQLSEIVLAIRSRAHETGPTWAEMTVDIESPAHVARLQAFIAICGIDLAERSNQILLLCDEQPNYQRQRDVLLEYCLEISAMKQVFDQLDRDTKHM